MERAYRRPPGLTVEDLGLELDGRRGDPIEELARYGDPLPLVDPGCPAAIEPDAFFDALVVVQGCNPRDAWHQEGRKAGALRVYLGSRDNTESWKMALEDLVGRGLAEPLLVVSDGNPGLIRAMKETWPNVLRQRCIAHRTRNVPNRAPKKDQKRILQALNCIFHSMSLGDALAGAEEFAAIWQNVYPSAGETPGKTWPTAWTFLRPPKRAARRWERLRTSNGLERCLHEVRRRTRVIGQFPTERSVASLVSSVIEQDSKKWCGIRMDDQFEQDHSGGGRHARGKLAYRSRRRGVGCRADLRHGIRSPRPDFC